MPGTIPGGATAMTGVSAVASHEAGAWSHVAVEVKPEGVLATAAHEAVWTHVPVAANVSVPVPDHVAGA
jgi:hypothetical protein